MQVFDQAYADGYDALYRDKDYAAECDLVERLLPRLPELAAPMRILDIGCGTGGHTLELARRGHQVEGIDRSEFMLKVARDKAAQRSDLPVPPHFLCADARNFQASRSDFDAALMMFAVIGYLNSNEELAQAMHNVARHLRSGGSFVFDCWWGPAVLTQRPSERLRSVETPDGKLLRAARTRLDSLACVAHVQFDLFHLHRARGYKEASETHRMRYFFGPELGMLMGHAGMRLERLGQFPQSDLPPDDASWNVIGIARKL